MAQRSSANFRHQSHAILVEHGLEAAARAIQRVGALMRDETIRRGIELGVLIDAATGEQLGDIVVGSRDQLELGPALRAMLPDHRYMCVHTHPGSTSLSPRDVGLLVDNPQVLAIVAVGADGTWYAGSFDPARVGLSLREVFDAYYAAYQATTDKYAALRAARQLTRRQAARLHSHEIWEHAAPLLGLRYDRLERGGMP